MLCISLIITLRLIQQPRKLKEGQDRGSHNGIYCIWCCSDDQALLVVMTMRGFIIDTANYNATLDTPAIVTIDEYENIDSRSKTEDSE